MSEWRIYAEGKRRLKRLGYGRDLEFCLAEDTVPVVPRLAGGTFVGDSSVPG